LKAKSHAKKVHKTKKQIKKAASTKKKTLKLKVKVAKSQAKNSLKQVKLRRSKDALAGKVRDDRAAIRRFRKKADDARLHNKATDFSAAKKKLLKFQANLKQSKSKFKKVISGLKKVKASIKDNRSTLIKITGRKQPKIHLKPHDRNRVGVLNTKIVHRNKILANLKMRLGKLFAYRRVARKFKNAQNDAMLKHINMRVKRLRRRIHRRRVIIMRNISRRFRISPDFMKHYKAEAKKWYTIMKNHLKISSLKQRKMVEKLQKRIQMLFRKRKYLVAKQKLLLYHVRRARNEKIAAKKTVVHHKKQVKKLSKTKGKSVKAAEVKKDLHKKKQTLKITKQKLRVTKTLRKKAAKAAQKVKLTMKKIAFKIKKMTGKKVTLPSLIATKNQRRVEKAITRKYLRIKRTKKDLKDAKKQLRKAKTIHGKEKTNKALAKVKKLEKRLIVRKADSKKFQVKKLKNKTVKKVHKSNLKLKKKAMKYKGKKTAITHRVNKHRAKAGI
jgi:hypothetical protein